MTAERIAVVQNGGGFTGANIGLWKALFRRGKIPKKIQGVSVGALNAAMVVQDGPETLEKHWRKVGHGKPGEIFSWKGVPWHIIKSEQSLLSDYGLNKLMENIDCQKIINSEIELEVVAMNKNKRRMEVFSSRDERFIKDPELLRKAIKASASLTGYFPKVKIGNDYYADGYYFHMDHLKGFDTIFVILNDDPCPAPEPDDGPPWYKDLRIGFRQVLDDMDERQCRDFLRDNPEFQLFSPPESDQGFFRTIIDKLKSFPANVAAKVEEVLTGEPQFPKRLIITSPDHSVPSLTLDDYRPGDIDRRIDFSNKQAEKLLDQVYPETKAAE
ncbi:MAG: patatin-like phospholipase family protein [Patescibacteria group bacterium]